MIFKRLAAVVAVTSAIAVVLAPSSLAVLDVGDGGTTGAGAIAALPVQGEPREPIGLVAQPVPDVFERAVQRRLDETSILPVRGEPRERIVVASSPTIPDLPKAPLVRSDASTVPAYTTTPAGSVANGGLDWSAFAAGAGSALGMALLAAVAVFSTRRRTAHS